jgi:hypothetical protein
MKKSLLILALLSLALPALTQGAITINTTGTDVYTQNFAGLPASATTYALDTDAVGTKIAKTGTFSLDGWYTNYSPLETVATSGGSTGLVAYQSYAGQTYEGSAGVLDAERALGSRNVSTKTPVIYGAVFTNSTGFDTLDVTIDYAGEQWFHGTAATGSLTFQYSLNASSITDFAATWVPVSALNFTAIKVSAGSGVKIDGNASANRIASIRSTLDDLAWLDGTDLWIRWTDVDETDGTDQGLAVDSFKLSVVPEPSTYALLLGFFVLGGVLLRRRLRS